MQPVSEHEKTVNVVPLKRDAQFWLRIVLVTAVALTVYYVPWIVVPFRFSDENGGEIALAPVPHRYCHYHCVLGIYRGDDHSGAQYFRAVLASI